VSRRWILLDLDGTLVDASPAIVAGVLEIAADAGLGAPDPAWVRGRIGHAPEETWRLLGAADPLALVHEFSRRILPKLDEGIVALPGARDALARMVSMGLRLGVATTRLTDSARRSLEATGLASYVEQVSGRDRVPRAKPAPDVLVDVLAALGGRVDEALMIGDSDADVGAAHAAGMPCWAVTGGVGDERALRQAGADLILGGIGEAPAALAARQVRTGR